MGLKVGPLRQVLLLLPFAWVFGAIHGQAVQVTLPGGSVLLQPTGAVSGDVGRFAATVLATVAITLQPVGADGPVLVPVPCAVLPHTLAGLNRFALRTTVPPSPASRSGAGGEVDDND